MQAAQLMKIMVFAEGTLFIGADDAPRSREERIRALQQVLAAQAPIHFRSSLPAGNAMHKRGIDSAG